jgi:CHASE1-domain containing sensor protein
MLAFSKAFASGEGLIQRNKLSLTNYYFYSTYKSNNNSTKKGGLTLLLFLVGMVAGGLISMVIMTILFVGSREDEISELSLRNLTACKKQ